MFGQNLKQQAGMMGGEPQAEGGMSPQMMETMRQMMEQMMKKMMAEMMGSQEMA